MKLLLNGYPVSAPYGSIDPSHLIPHKGIDLAMPLGSPVSSIGEGVVTAITDEGSKSFGKAVHVHLTNGNDVIYGHLSQFKVSVGQHVHTGQVVGLSGSTGDSTGPHLHLQVMQNGHPIDPTPSLQFHQWTLWEIMKNPNQYIHDELYQVCEKVMMGVDSLAFLLVCAGILGIMLSIPKAGQFTGIVFGVYIIIKLLGAVT